MPVVDLDTASDFDPELDAVAALMATPTTPTEAFIRALLARPAWHELASCRGRGGDVSFFPTRGEDVTPAVAVCAGCSVREQCRSAGEGETGVWGGLSERRRKLERRHSAA